MKKALILHGTSGSSQENWFPWLADKLESEGFSVWVPDLPSADKPNIDRYNEFLFSHKKWDFDSETIIIGHSSGAVAIFGLLEALPEGVMVNACYLVGSFSNDLKWEALKDLFLRPFNFELIREKSRLFYFIHSDNDPYCPLEQAEYLHSQIGGDLLVLPGQKHFSVGTAGETYRQFPYLLHLILGDSMTQDEVTSLYQGFLSQDVQVWLDGGWGVDALLEKQTRPHSDLDIVIQKDDVSPVSKYLQQQGYHKINRLDQSEWNFVYGDGEARFIDFHVIEVNADGDGIYGPAEKGDIYKKEALDGKGKIGAIEVKCISPEWMVRFHTGYKLRPQDYLDVKNVCGKFSIELPEEYK